MVSEVWGDLAGWAATFVAVGAASVAFWQGRSARSQARSAASQAADAKRAADAAESQVSVLLTQLEQAERHYREEQVRREKEILQDLLITSNRYVQSSIKRVRGKRSDDPDPRIDITVEEGHLDEVRDRLDTMLHRVRYSRTYSYLEHEIVQYVDYVESLNRAVSSHICDSENPDDGDECFFASSSKEVDSLLLMSRDSATQLNAAITAYLDVVEEKSSNQ